MTWLRQSTAVTVKLGPFIDDADGKTAETGLTINQGDVRLSKNGGDYAQKNESSACTHDEIGEYDCDLDATDTNTLGRLRVMIQESGALPVWRDFMVVPANVWDSLFGSDFLQIDLKQILGTTLTETAGQLAARFKDFFDQDSAEYNIKTALALEATLTAIKGSGWVAADNLAEIAEDVAGLDGGTLLTAALVWAHATRTLTQSAATTYTQVEGSTITLCRGDTLSASLTGLGSIAARDNVWFTVKPKTGDVDDEDATIQIDTDNGLLAINGSNTGVTAANGSISVDDEDDGDITVTLKPIETAKLSVGDNYVYDVQMLTNAGVITTLTSGQFRITEDVTKATS